MKKWKPYLFLSLAVLILIVGGYGFWANSVEKTTRFSAARYSKLDRAVSDGPITAIPLNLNLDTRKVALGRRLFNDVKLSGDNTISCTHCHSLSRAGVDNLPYSIGVKGVAGRVNTPTVLNSGLNYLLFWDGRAVTLEQQLDDHLKSTDGMSTSWPVVIARLEADAVYRSSFELSYSAGITPAKVMDAMASFERSLTTPNAKFDQFLRGAKDSLDSEEFAGYVLFRQLGCASCHQGVNVGGNLFDKLGPVDDYFAARGHLQRLDLGRYNQTSNAEHRYQFRVPSLRNVALTAPYFHDASVATLSQAVAIMGEYQLGVTLKPLEINRIVLFLNTLTGDAVSVGVP